MKTPLSNEELDIFCKYLLRLAESTDYEVIKRNALSLFNIINKIRFSTDSTLPDIE